MKAIVLGKYHFVLYFLVLAMQVGSNLVLSLPLQIGSHFLISIHQPFMVNSFYLFIYFLLLQPRMFMAVDENNKALSVPVRVGQAVDVVGQAGRPKTITGFQTHSTPVLLAAGDRAELATEK
jgi:26S proteasome regulatory subunit N1